MERGLDLMLGGPRGRQAPGILSSQLQFSAQTSAARTQQAIIHRLIKKSRDTLGAPKGKKVKISGLYALSYFLYQGSLHRDVRVKMMQLLLS